ncbi:hypothetical protein JW960_14095 [candidate division KSB1 bacterium]|nr:hypothetical protein [candidate division KSB1 bacterium]
MEPIQNLWRILAHIDGISDELVRRTDAISNLLMKYDMDEPMVDELLETINDRNQFVESLNKKHHEMDEIVQSIPETASMTPEITMLQSKISAKLNAVIEADTRNQHLISRHRDLVALQINSLLTGKKVTRAYNVVPHRKALFVDMMNRK